MINEGHLNYPERIHSIDKDKEQVKYWKETSDEKWKLNILSAQCDIAELRKASVQISSMHLATNEDSSDVIRQHLTHPDFIILERPEMSMLRCKIKGMLEYAKDLTKRR